MRRGKHSCSRETLAALMRVPAIKTTTGAPARSAGVAGLTYILQPDRLPPCPKECPTTE
jgi:hypothetical protein